MANTWLSPQQLSPAATTLTALYEVPASTQFVGYLNITNRSATATSFRISVAPDGATDSVEQYLHYDQPIAGNDTMRSNMISADGGDVVRIYATLATLSFSLMGVEKTA